MYSYILKLRILVALVSKYIHNPYYILFMAKACMGAHTLPVKHTSNKIIPECTNSMSMSDVDEADTVHLQDLISNLT